MTLFLHANMQNRISFESLWHRKGDESYRESITQLHRTQWAKNRISGPKIENRLWKPEKHFQIKTNAHFGYNRTQWKGKIRSLSRNRKCFIFCCIVYNQISRDACFMVHFICQMRLCGTGSPWGQLRLCFGEGQVKVRSRSGQGQVKVRPN